MKLKKVLGFLLILVLFSGCYYNDPYYGNYPQRTDSYDVMPRLRLPIERTVVIERGPELGVVNVFEGVMSGYGY